MRGILNINKSSGMTSFDVVSRLRRLLHEKRIGHGGTLDPLADGVLPVFVGTATRVSEYMLEHPKTYLSTIKLGYESNTYDAEGEISFIKDPSYVNAEMAETELKSFVGDVMQIPPVFSAIKKNGQSLYKSARNGDVVDLEPRPVTIDACDLLAFDNPFVTIRVRCARGTYIRSIAHDLGEKLGCGGYITRLTREKYGPFDIQDALTVEQIERLIDEGMEVPFYEIDHIMDGWEHVDLNETESQDLINGKTFSFDSNAQKVAVYRDGTFLAVAEKVEDGIYHPSKVFI